MNHKRVYRLYREEGLTVRRKRKGNRAAGTARVPLQLPRAAKYEDPIIASFDANGQQIAVVHQYLRPDGCLGASGQRDPKKIFFKGVLYVARCDPSSARLAGC